jgi:hypothetical protein
MVLGICTVMEQAVRDRTAKSFMEQHEHNCDFDAFVREVVGVMLAVAFKKAVGFEFSKIVSELRQTVVFYAEGRGDSFMNHAGCKTGDGRPRMKQYLHESHDSGVMYFYPRYSCGTLLYRQGKSLEKRKVEVSVEPESRQNGLLLKEKTHAPGADCPGIFSDGNRKGCWSRPHSLEMSRTFLIA